MQCLLPFRIRLYLWTVRQVRRLSILMDACLTGFWLGVLDKADLDAIGKLYYDDQRMYYSDEYNESGLRDWEATVLESHFAGSKRLLVGGSGGGREVLALLQRGYSVDAYDCQPGLVESANRLLVKHGYDRIVRQSDRDTNPELCGDYDGIILGWGMYMLIADRQSRISFLRTLRAAVGPDTPVLISFFARSGAERRFRVIALIANIFRTALGRHRLELGDDLDPNYVHYFDRDEISDELRAGGFTLMVFNCDPYGHAIALSRKQLQQAADCVSHTAVSASAGLF